MVYYATYGEFQQELSGYYNRTGNRLQFPEAIARMYKKEKLITSRPLDRGDIFNENLNDTTFDARINLLPFPIPNIETLKKSEIVTEDDLIPANMDVFTFRHPRLTRTSMHRHNYFEINYVASGDAHFLFENEERVLKEGEFCFIAPSSLHDIRLDDEKALVYTICIRSSTFNSSFFSLLSRKDLLSYFFRTILQGKDHPNYLLFYTSENPIVRTCARMLLIECSSLDPYSNACCISYINILLSAILRSYSETISFYDYKMGTDFSLMLQYIQHNYQTLTLSSLASLFHYSEPHLCTLIRQNTGLTFTALIKQLRLSDSVEYLIHTDLKISEIADRVGYNSADHFSRVFRSSYKMSPMEYRKLHQYTDGHTPKWIVEK